MSFLSKIFSNKLDESISAFKNKEQNVTISSTDTKKSGEGIEDIALLNMAGNYGSQSIGSFNGFYNSYLNKTFENEIGKILDYRRMAEYPEISDVIEDACNEVCDVDEDENLLTLNITDEKLSENDNISKILYKEFKTLFYERIDINDILWDLMRTYFIDGRVYYERIIDQNNKNRGILAIRKLPTETMDFEYDPKTGKTHTYYQYLSPNLKRPSNRRMAEEEAKTGRMIVFEPAQIGYINYGIYGLTKFNVNGFLERAKVPYNQLKLLETSVVIYRLIRSPERLVFKVDTGAMPREKALKFVEKIKQSFVKKQSYNPQTGALTNEAEVFCIRQNTKIPLADGRSLSLIEIVNEHKLGISHDVFSIDQITGIKTMGKVVNAAITRKDEKLIRVHTKEGFFDTTYDHKYLVYENNKIIEVEAQNLTEEMELVD